MNKKVIGLIPAAGKGTRLGWATAKELWPIEICDGLIMPVLQSTIDNMVMADVQEAVIVTTPEKPEIMRYLSTMHTMRIAYVCQAHNYGKGKSSGLIEAIESAYHLTKETIVVFGMPDTYVRPNTCYDGLIEKVRDDGYDVAFGLFPTETPHKFGIVDFDGNMDVRYVFEKPRTTMLQYMWGILVWSPTFTEYIHTSVQQGIVEYDIILNNALQLGMPMCAKIVQDGQYADLGTQADILRVWRE